MRAKGISEALAIVLMCLTLGACGGGSDGTPAPIDGDGDGESSELENDSDAESEGDSEVGPLPYPTEPAKRVVYDLRGPTSINGNTACNRVPFPYNYFLKDDVTAVSGKRINLLPPPAKYLPCTNSVLIDDGLKTVNLRYITHLNTIDGFSTFGPLLIEVNAELDSASLPQTPEASVLPQSTVSLVNITKDAAEFGERVPLHVEFKEAQDTKQKHLFWYLIVRPAKPLKGLSTYALVVQDGLKTKDGTALGASAHFQIVSGRVAIEPTWKQNTTLLAAERDRLAPTIAALTAAPIGLDKQKLLLAIDISTQSVDHDMRTIQAQYESGALPAPAPNFDVTGDEKADLFTLENLADYPKDVPGLPEADKPFWASVGGALRGYFTSSDFRAAAGDTTIADRKRDFRYDAQGDPVPQVKDTRLPFVVFYPKSSFPEPYPVIIVQHGIYSRKEYFYDLVPNFTGQGYAVAMMDFPYHGEREGEGVGMPPLEFIDFSYPLKARASFMQGALDQLQLARLLASWTGDFFPAGGDGKADIDTARIGYWGHSLGGIVGTTTFGLSKDMNCFVSTAGGGGLVDFLGYFMSAYGLGVAYPEYQLMEFAVIMQTVLDAGDNINYVSELTQTPKSGERKRSYLLQEMGGFSEVQEDGTTKTQVGDEVVPNVASENDARAIGLPLLNPPVHEVWGLTPTDGPLSGFGMSQFYPATHQTVDQTYPETRARLVSQYQHFFKTAFETGTGEIIAVPASPAARK